MKTFVLVLTAASLALPALAQQSELPNAPSAVLQQQQQQNKPAAATPQPNKPVNDIATPDEPKPAAPVATNAAPDKPNATQPSADDDQVTRFVVHPTEVNVVFTVTDKHGKFVKDLKKDDFRVLDDTRPVQAITGFSRETNLPLRVGLLIDASNSIRERFTFEQESAIEFLHQVIRPKFDQAFVLGFDSTPEVTQDFTDNAEQLAHGIRMLRPGGGTALWDAIYYACRDKLMAARSQGPVRRAIIVISDGDDNQSRVTREEAIEMAQRAEVIVYTISTNVSGSLGRGDKYMQRMAEATGGRAFNPFKVQDVANALGEIQDELRSQYALAYRPEVKNDGRYHSIDIIAQNHKNLRVRARKGYYATKQ